MKLIQAPIDNKNILEDFTDIFHNGSYIESRNRNQVRQAFYINGLLFELTYHFGCNYFRIECLSEIGTDDIPIIKDIVEKVESMNMDDVIVRYNDDKMNVIIGLFYFVES